MPLVATVYGTAIIPRRVCNADFEGIGGARGPALCYGRVLFLLCSFYRPRQPFTFVITAHFDHLIAVDFDVDGFHVVECVVH